MPDTPPVYLEIKLKGTTHTELWDNLLNLVTHAIESKNRSCNWPMMVGSNAGTITVKKKPESFREIKIYVKESINEHGVIVWEFFHNDKLLGHMYRTYSAGWYEAFLDNAIPASHRVQSEEEAAEWIFQKHFNQ